MSSIESVVGQRDGLLEVIDNRILDAVPRGAPSELDLANPGHLDTVRSVAESMELVTESPAELLAADQRIGADPEVPVLARVALKLATSRLLFREIGPPTHVSVVFAVYKEHTRILTSREHPAGEDFVRQKLRQLRWLFESAPQHSWDLTVVDDGCPEGSGGLVQAVLDDFSRPGEEVRVLFLEDAIAESLPILRDLESTAQSRKGGSIRLGLWNAARMPRDASKHVVLFTDADLSTHLGQVGLLVSPLMEAGRQAAVGSRREPSSVVVKAGVRNVRGKLFVYLWKRLIPQLGGIIDTQCGFKAFDARQLASWIGSTRESGFSFDVELLLRVQLGHSGSLTKVPIAWIDSEAASTTTELDPYLSMLQRIADLYRDVLPADPGSDSYARLIDQLDEESFRHLVANIPPEIADREPFEFEDYDGTSAADLASIVRMTI